MRVVLVIAVILLAAVAACIETSPARQRAAEAPLPADSVAVIVSPSRGTPTVGADGPFIIVDAEGRTVHSGRRLDDGTTVRARQSGVELGARDLPPPPLELRPQGKTRLTAGGVAYRGVLRLESEGRTVVINRVPVEEYLLGVVPAEMSDRFGLEALKAQAVAARSYALNEMSQRGRLQADQRSQVYKGIAAETLVTTRAVKQTAGQVLTRHDEIIPAWFHSTCGGTTTGAHEVFPNVPTGLLARSVPCPDCRASPHFEWTRSFSEAEVVAALGLNSGHLRNVTASAVPYPARPRQVEVDDGRTTETLSAATFRSRLSSGRGYSEQLLSTLWAHAPRLHDGKLVLQGRGWGHGVGMCQYGARGYAAKGASYDDILRRYYPGTDLALAR